MRFKTQYMDDALFDLENVIERARQDLAGIDFDTFVVTGMSGALVAPALALAMGKTYVVLRKENDNSHHGGGQPIGELGKRWIFLDDFVSTGRTRERVLKGIDLVIERRAAGEPITRYVGDYMYRLHGYRFMDAEAAHVAASERAVYYREVEEASKRAKAEREEMLTRFVERQAARDSQRSVYDEIKGMWEAETEFPETGTAPDKFLIPNK